MEVFLAASSKSSALIRDSSGGFSEELFGAALGISSSRGLDHASVTMDVSRMPLRALAGRPSLMIEGWWIAEYGFVASRPAYLYITACCSQYEAHGDRRRQRLYGRLETDFLVRLGGQVQSL